MRISITLILISVLLLSCSSSQKPDQEQLVKEGKAIAMQTGKSLVGELQRAMAEGGVPHALRFCNVEALPITDSLSQAHDATIRRASHRPRNPANQATDVELEIIQNYQRQMAEEQQLKPVIRTHEDGDQVDFYAPITINNALCLNCHGQPETDIQPQNVALIDSLYPTDQAKGFAMDELRGIWSITFEPK
jgi:hypothetical protein